MSFDHTYDRRKSIGASEAAAVLGLNPYRTALDVWQEKTGRVAATSSDSKWSRLGNALEPVVADLYAAQTGFELRDLATTLVHADRPIHGTPDRIVMTRDAARVVEIKTAWNSRTIGAWGEEGTDAVPDHYRVQGVIYMALTALDRCDFALFAAGDLKVYTIHRDHEVERETLDRLSDWWATYVVADVAPPVNSGADLDALKRRWTASSGVMLKAGPMAIEIAREYAEAVAAAEAASERADLAKARLQEAIADADGIEGATFRATWKFAKGASRVDWESVAKAAGASRELIEANTKLGAASRRFLFKEMS
jgi:putative phage-type endonuclease